MKTSKLIVSGLGILLMFGLNPINGWSQTSDVEEGLQENRQQRR
jgi:hypothetical protein